MNAKDELRRKAEETLQTSMIVIDDMSEEEIWKLVHELQVHQIELEMQNEDLRHTHAELEESRTKYADLYDFAPVGYFTFDKNGLICEANLTGARLLGIERGLLIKKPFSQYIMKDHQKVCIGT